MSVLTDDYNHFRRLHPLTLIYKLIRNLPYLLLTYYLAIFQNQPDEKIYIIITLFFGIFLVPSQILVWYYFTYQISEKEIIVQSGVFSRKQRNIPIERVQNVNVKQDFLQRILGLAIVQIETAGDSRTEATLEYVRLKEADEINRIIRLYQKKNIDEKIDNDNSKFDIKSYISGKSETFNPTESANVIFEMTKRDLIIFGMVRLRPLFLVYGIWAMSFVSQYPKLSNIFNDYLQNTVDTVSDISIYYLLPIILISAIFVLLISWIADIVWTYVQFYGFKLVKDGNKLVISYGLLSRNSVTIPLKKLQQVTISTNPIKKKFNLYSMSLYTAGFDASNKRSPSIIPLAKKEKLEEAIEQIYPIEIPDDFKPISKKTIRRIFVKFMFALLPAMGVLYYYYELYALYSLVLIPISFYISYLVWKYRAYSIKSNLVFVKQGFWYQKINIIPLNKIQTLHITDTIFQRRLDLATVHIDTAAQSNRNDAIIPDIDGLSAVNIFEELNLNFKLSNKISIL